MLNICPALIQGRPEHWKSAPVPIGLDKAENMHEQLRVRHLNDREERESPPLPTNPNDSEMLASKLRDQTIKNKSAKETFGQ